MLSKAQVQVVQITTRILQVLQQVAASFVSQTYVPVVPNTARAGPSLPGVIDVPGPGLPAGIDVLGPGLTAGIDGTGVPGLAHVTGQTAGIGKPAAETGVADGVDPGAITGLGPCLLLREVMPNHCASCR